MYNFEHKKGTRVSPAFHMFSFDPRKLSVKSNLPPYVLGRDEDDEVCYGHLAGEMIKVYVRICIVNNSSRCVIPLSVTQRVSLVMTWSRMKYF